MYQILQHCFDQLQVLDFEQKVDEIYVKLDRNCHVLLQLLRNNQSIIVAIIFIFIHITFLQQVVHEIFKHLKVFLMFLVGSFINQNVVFIANNSHCMSYKQTSTDLKIINHSIQYKTIFSFKIEYPDNVVPSYCQDSSTIFVKTHRLNSIFIPFVLFELRVLNIKYSKYSINST